MNRSKTKLVSMSGKFLVKISTGVCLCGVSYNIYQFEGHLDRWTQTLASLNIAKVRANECRVPIGSENVGSRGRNWRGVSQQKKKNTLRLCV